MSVVVDPSRADWAKLQHLVRRRLALRVTGVRAEVQVELDGDLYVGEYGFRRGVLVPTGGAVSTWALRGTQPHLYVDFDALEKIQSEKEVMEILTEEYLSEREAS